MGSCSQTGPRHGAGHGVQELCCPGPHPHAILPVSTLRAGMGLTLSSPPMTEPQRRDILSEIRNRWKQVLSFCFLAITNHSSQTPAHLRRTLKKQYCQTSKEQTSLPFRNYYRDDEASQWYQIWLRAIQEKIISQYFLWKYMPKSKVKYYHIGSNNNL